MKTSPLRSKFSLLGSIAFANARLSAICRTRGTPPQELEIKPAYGRKYDSKSEALSDWIGGKDFATVHGYISIRETADAKERGYKTFRIVQNHKTLAYGRL